MPRSSRLPAHLILAIAVALMVGCDGSPFESKPEDARTLADIKESGELVVVTRNAPTTRYIGRHGEPTGPEHDLVTAFAREIGVDIRWKNRPTVTAILEAVNDGEADLAAAGLTVTPERKQRFRFGPSYQSVTQQVVCRRDNVQPERPEDLVGLDLEVIAESSYTERLRALRRDKLTELDWTINDTATTEMLLRRVWQKAIDCTVADSNIVAVNRRYYPELIAPFNLSREQDLAWAMPPYASKLEGAIADWLTDFRSSGLLEKIHEEYYSFFKEFDFVDIRAFIRRVDKRFPRYREYFLEAAEKYDLPFTLIAAQGYQESHWRANARSPTGVRGIMMLTSLTAEELGVTDRLDPRQSIMGGAQYLARMKKRFKDAVPEPDRTRLALAAYNIGRGHIHDAQTLARKRGLDPHSWQDIRQVLPLLTKPEHYRQLNYGYARGWEPVRYVRRIREYRHVLEQELAEDAT